MTFDVIIPVKARPTIVSCISSLLSSPLVNRILICDAGSTSANTSEVLEQLTLASLDLSKLHVLHYPMMGFNKSKLINHGLLNAIANFVLISDADIIWNSKTLENLYHQIHSQENLICCVDNVRESNSDAIALKRDRYTYRITHTPNETHLAIQPVIGTKPIQRPGCGLLGTQRTTLLRLGGYKELFQGWGWEDQDLLIRAQLVGIQVETTGEVIHLSHDDRYRNPFHNHLSPSDTRNYNIWMAIASLLQHQFKGDLTIQTPALSPPQNLQIYLPDSLRKWLDEQDLQSISDPHLSAARNTLKNTISLVATSEQQWLARPV